MSITSIQDAYPSRISDQPEIIPRRDPVIHGDRRPASGDGLSAARLEQYERDGFLVLPRFFSDGEVGVILDRLESLKRDDAIGRRREAIVEPEGLELRSLFAIHRIDEFFAEIAADERFVAIARQLLGSEVYVHQSRINLKPGFAGKEFYWHSDFETWHTEDGMPRMRAVSFSLLLTPNYEHNGPLMLVPGSHQYFIASIGETPENHYETSLKRQEFGVPDPQSLQRFIDKGGITRCLGPAGTLVIFECNTLHGSNGNITPYPRSNLFMVYNSVENKVTAPYCGQPPRPDYIAHRGEVEPIRPRGRFHDNGRDV